MSEPLTDAYLQEAEYRARRFSGAYTGTSGTLAADVMRLLAELSRVKGELAVERARREQHTCRWGDDPSGPYVSDEFISGL
jgi:hypothetical protein